MQCAAGGVERLAQAGQAATETGWGGTGGACQPATGGEKVNLSTGAQLAGEKAMHIGIIT